MSRSSKSSSGSTGGVIEVKSKFDAEFRRFGVEKSDASKFEDFRALIENLHGLKKVPFVITYTDPKDGDLLPINNDDNYQRALSIARPLLRLIVQRKDQTLEINGYGTIGSRKNKNPLSKLVAPEVKPKVNLAISMPEDFRRVSAIIDVEIVPETHRRVKLMKNGSDKPLGFYIRDGTSVRVTPGGLEKVPGIFISRLVPGGLAESTGLLAVNDEVLEVNGIEVSGKTLDQVTDMMVANSSNLIITVKPVNQRNNISPKRSVISRASGKSVGSTSLASTSSVGGAASSTHSYDSDAELGGDLHEEDEDEVKTLINPASSNSAPSQQQHEDLPPNSKEVHITVPDENTLPSDNPAPTHDPTSTPSPTPPSTTDSDKQDKDMSEVTL